MQWYEATIKKILAVVSHQNLFYSLFKRAWCLIQNGSMEHVTMLGKTKRFADADTVLRSMYIGSHTHLRSDAQAAALEILSN